MASYDKTKDTDYTLAVQSALKSLGADLGSAGVDGKWGDYTEAAYQKNKTAVDAILGELGVTGRVSLTPSLVDEPEIRSFDEWMSMADAIYAAQAEAQEQRARRQLEYNQEELQRQKQESAAALETAANSRGFGRSSYALDVLQRNENNAQRAGVLLLNNFSDALMEIEANRAVNAAQYASELYRAQQNNLLEAQRFNAQQTQAVNQALWERQNTLDAAAAKAASAGSKSSSSKSSSKKSGSTADASVSILSALKKEAETPKQKMSSYINNLLKKTGALSATSGMTASK